MIYTCGKYKNFDKLFKINKIIIHNYNNEIRVDENEISKINSLMNNLYKKHSMNIRIKVALYVSAIILLRQPFFDGNSRTIKAFLKNYFKGYGLLLDISEKDFIIPLFYFETDNINNNDIKKLKKRLKTNSNL